MVYVLWCNGGQWQMVECCDLKNNKYGRGVFQNGTGASIGTPSQANSGIFSYSNNTFTINTVNSGIGVIVIAY